MTGSAPFEPLAQTLPEFLLGFVDSTDVLVVLYPPCLG